jgi:hypothetical protein
MDSFGARRESDVATLGSYPDGSRTSVMKAILSGYHDENFSLLSKRRLA